MGMKMKIFDLRIAFLVPVLLLAGASCGESRAGGDSETHFLRRCADECGDGLSCICGICTQACDDDLACSSLAPGAACLESPGDSCAEARPICEMACTRDADCEALGASYRCDAGPGMCRSEAPGGGGAGGLDGACDDFVPLATAAEVALAGREDTDAEILALRASGQLVAPTALYDRIHTDLEAVRALEPAVAEVHVWDVFYNWLSLQLDEASFSALESGEYHAWDCANAHYGLSSTDIVGVRSVALSFEPKRYLVPLLVGQYETFEGVVSAGVGTSGDGADICLIVNGSDHRYLFDDASDGCGVICNEHIYSGFDVSMDGDVTPLGSYCESQTGACPDNPEQPDWLAPLLAACSPWAQP